MLRSFRSLSLLPLLSLGLPACGARGSVLSS